MEKIENCKKCSKRKFDMRQGIVCSLTNEKPIFLDSCPDFSIDESVQVTDTKLINPNLQKAKIAIILISIVLAFDMISLFSDFLEFKLLKTAQSVGITDEMANNNDNRQMIIGGLYFIIYIISAVAFIQWFWTGYSNLQKRIKHCSHSDGWAIGCWFVPIIAIYRPYQMMKEMWNETVKKIKLFDNDFTLNYNVSIIGWWWTFWIISSYIGNFALKYAFKSDSIEELITSSIANMILSIIGIPLALTTIKMIKSYSQIEEKLRENGF